MCHYYLSKPKPGLVNQVRVEVKGDNFLVDLCLQRLSLGGGLGRKTILSTKLFVVGVPCLIIFSIGSPAWMPIAGAGELDGQGLSCVGVKGSTKEDLYYGFVFINGRVKALSIVRGGLYVPSDDEDVPYTFDGQDRIEWSSKNPLPETRTPSSGFTHVVDRRTLKHMVLGEKGGFKGGLCYFDTVAGVKNGLLQIVEFP